MEVRLFICLFLLSFVQQGMSARTPTDDLMKQLDDYVNEMKSELEIKYEARIQTLEADMVALKSDFAVKEGEYKLRIEASESTVDQLREVKDRPETSTKEEQETPVKTAKTQDKQKTAVFGSRVVSSKLVKKRQVLSQTESKIAFFASLTNNVQHMGENQDIAFDKVVTNLGSAYNGHHGTFIAPIAGTYIFYATLLSWTDTTWGHIVVNGSIVAKLSVKIHGSQSSQTVIVHLNEGDDVSIQNTAVDKTITGDMYCTFGGFLLYADVTPEVVG